MEKQNWARYAGTEIVSKGWWPKIYRKGLLWVRGNGSIQLADDGIVFKRYGVSQPIVIPYNSIKEIKFGRWHARGWQIWQIIKIIWQKNGQLLSTGFGISRNKEKTKRFADEIKKRTAQSAVHLHD